jgi:hypothetical protein
VVLRNRPSTSVRALEDGRADIMKDSSVHQGMGVVHLRMGW